MKHASLSRKFTYIVYIITDIYFWKLSSTRGAVIVVWTEYYFVYRKKVIPNSTNYGVMFYIYIIHITYTPHTVLLCYHKKTSTKHCEKGQLCLKLELWNKMNALYYILCFKCYIVSSLLCRSVHILWSNNMCIVNKSNKTKNKYIKMKNFSNSVITLIGQLSLSVLLYSWIPTQAFVLLFNVKNSPSGPPLSCFWIMAFVQEQHNVHIFLFFLRTDLD